MPTYTVEKLPGEPIVMITAHEDYDPSEDAKEAVLVVNTILDELDESVTFIQDLTLMKVDLDDIMVGADTTGRGDEATFHHPNIREIISVTQDPIMRNVFEGMGSSAYGNVRMLVVDTLDEALAYARQH
ncbi:MAG: hypothetical protein JW966_16450 [Anaerolineae bacterium]|nr:hypothetical protein [Anaerolineae bacterium]